MTNIMAVVEQLVMLLCMTGVGYLMRRRRVMTTPVIKGVNALLLQVAWPCMILMTTQKPCTDEAVRRFLVVMCVTAMILAVASLVMYQAARHWNKAVCAPVFSLLAFMPNAGFVGMPIIKAVYGDTGVLYLAAFLVGFNLVVWTIGVFLFSGVSLRSLRNVLNPGFVSSLVGTALFLLRISLPAPLLSAVNQLGSLTTPLAMLLLGARLDQFSWPLPKKPILWISCAIKLLVIPLLTFALMRLFHMDSVLTGVCVMSMAMPAASVAQLLAEKNNGDIQLAVAGVSFSMLLCLVTIPLIMLIAM